MNPPLRVLHLVAPGEVGGGESVVIALATGLHHSGVQVGVAPVVSSPPECHPVIRALSDAGVPVQSIHVTRRGYLAERRQVRRLLAERRPDVVHTHGYRADLLHAGIARRMGIPTVTTIHGSSRMSWRTAIYESIQFRLLRHFDAVIAVSRPLAEAIHRAGVPREQICLVPNAWNGHADPLPRAEARKLLGLPLDAFIVGWVGRLIPVKGCDVFLRALGLLRDVEIHGSVIGTGPEQPALEALSAKLGLAGRVHFHGTKENAARLFRAFDVWVLSSRSEGTPMVLFEAMAAGVPIVAVRVGGVPDVLSEVEACLVPPENPVVLADRLQEIRLGQSRAHERADAAWQRLVRHYGPDQWIDQHLHLYRRLARQCEVSPTPTQRAGGFANAVGRNPR